MTKAVQIAGAGPAGLAAAITLARAGRKVVVHEAHPTVGCRFGPDLQGLENWTSETDVLDEWRELGLATDFARLPCRRGTVFDARGRALPVRSSKPLFYTIERGPAPWSLDSALLAQAQMLGVEVRFRSRQEQLYVRRTVETFRRLVGLEMLNPQPHGGVGSFRLPVTGRSGSHAVAGEQAGLQDALWGFGIRFAIRSGVLAARSLIEGSDYETLWRREIGPLIEASIVDRAIYGLLGNRGYGLLLRYQARGDARNFLRRHYGPLRLKRALAPRTRQRYRSARRDASCDHVECACVWCRCGGVPA